ncbi:MAG: response regulator [Zoogloea sp.]|nr:response regulator [Zoogloea sp.]
MNAAPPGQALFTPRSFLLVEDFDAMRGILRNLLWRCGARKIEVAANAQEALTILRRGKCDVVLCDYHLGPGMNGQNLLEEARQAGLVSAATIWIMVTSEKTTEMVMSAVEHQPDDYLIKPITEAALQSRLEKLINRKTTLARIAGAMRSREYMRALDLCREQLKDDRANAMEIQRIQYDLFMLTGQQDEARALCDAILARRDVAWAKAGLAKLHFHEGRLNRARDLLEQIIEDNRNYVEAYDWLARIHQRNGAWEEAEQILQQAVAVSPNSQQRQNALGDTALRCEHLDVAEQAYQKSLKLTARTQLKTAPPYLGLARVYSARKKPEEALKMLGQMADDLDGDEARLQAKAEEVRVHHAAGNREFATAAAREVSERIRSGTQNLSPDATLNLADTFMLLGDRDTATHLVQFVVRNNHEDEDIATRAQAVFERANLGNEGRKLVEASRREAIDAMDQAVRLSSQGQLDEALEWMREAKSLMPRNPRLLLNHAYVVIKQLEKNGWRHDMDGEARRSITTARQIVPGEKRCGELLAKLESLN